MPARCGGREEAGARWCFAVHPLCPSTPPAELDPPLPPQDYLAHAFTSNSVSTKDASDQLRNETLAFFGASPDDYIVSWHSTRAGSTACAPANPPAQ